MSSRYLSFLTVVVLVLAGLSPGAAAQDTCYADMDVDGNGLPLSVGDYVLVLRYFAGDTTIAVEPYHLDLNGDCAIDAADLELFACFFANGMSCFDGVFPVPTCCNPEVITGACCEGDSCSQRTLGNCLAMGGFYGGDGTACNDTICSCCEMRGDIDHSGSLNISDVTYMVAYLFQGAPPPPCPTEADLNGDGELNVEDLAAWLIPLLFNDFNDIVPCPGTYPISRTYQFELYDSLETLTYVDTLHLTFFGADASNLILGRFNNGLPEDSVRGQGIPYDGMNLQNLYPLSDAGFTATLSVQGDIVAGSIDQTTVAGIRHGYVIMRQF